MGDVGEPRPDRGIATTETWSATCKDCRREQGLLEDPPADENTSFEYSDAWATAVVERGGSRSDRCPDHRKSHRQTIQSLAVAYVDLVTIGEVTDREDPSGPLGGLGPLPVTHGRQSTAVDLAEEEFGLQDPDIVKLLAGLESPDKRVAVLEAGTGTGKSTFGPFRLMKPPPGVNYRPTDFGPIVVTEPRVPATTGVAGYVGETLCFGHDPSECREHMGPGFPVGYQVSGDKRWDAACDLIFVTDGTMINWLREGRLAEISMVIVDEAHERSENIDIVLGLLKQAVARYEHLRVIITSATIDKDFFVGYFGGPERVHYQYVEAAKTIGYGVPLFPTEEIGETEILNGLRYGDGEDECWPGWPTPNPDDGEAEDLRATTRRLLELRAQVEIDETRWIDEMPQAVADQALRLIEAEEFGDILGFLPSRKLIEDCIAKIQRGLRRLGRSGDVDVFDLLSTTPPEVKDASLLPSEPGRTKIVISSNLAETSLTVKGVRFVIDSGLITQTEWDPELATARIPTKEHSKSGVRQRWGRVGRNAPGWVFPLYTKAQFLNLAPNTPSGSTRANLEQLVMKVKSAGIDDIEAFPFPAAPEDDVPLDEKSREASGLFRRELARANNALESSGALDPEGDLTEFGKEVERFKGSPARAVAVMLGDQLACVVEVATAMTLLEGGQLLSRRGGSLLRYDAEWPAAWQVEAAARHRGLAVGCADDLDLALHLFSQWEQASDPSKWCANWFVDETVLLSARVSRDELLESLSPAMKDESYKRPLELRLIPKARAVITKATANHLFESDDGETYFGTAPGSGDAVVADLVLTNPSRSVIALNRYRPNARGDETPAIVMSHLVNVVPWALDGSTDDDAGIDLLLAAAENLDAREALPVPVAALHFLRSHLPVGTTLTTTAALDQLGEVRLGEISQMAAPFGLPPDIEEYEDFDEIEVNPDEFDDEDIALVVDEDGDGNWDPNENPDPEIPPEELAWQVLDPADPDNDLEHNDQPLTEAAADTSHDPLTAWEVVAPGINQRPVLISTDPGHPLPTDEPVSLRITGYNLNEQRAAVYVTPISAKQVRTADPAGNDDLQPGTAVQLRVSDFRNDHGRWRYRQLDRTDGQGSFLVHERMGGLDPNDREHVSRLRPGHVINAVVISGQRRAERLTVSLLRDLNAELENSEALSLEVEPGRRRPFRAATVVEPPNDNGYLTVEITGTVGEGFGGLRFGVKEDDCVDAGIDGTRIGEPLFVMVGAHFGPQRERLPASKERLREVVELHDRVLLEETEYETGESRGTIRANTSISNELFSQIYRLDDRVAWHRKVWQFWATSHYRRVTGVLPSSASSSARPVAPATRTDRPTAEQLLGQYPQGTPVRAHITSIRDDLGRTWLTLDDGTECSMASGKIGSGVMRISAWLEIGNVVDAVVDGVSDRGRAPNLNLALPDFEAPGVVEQLAAEGIVAGAVIDGTVDNAKDGLGIFVKVAPGTNGLMHLKNGAEPFMSLTKGDPIRARVESVGLNKNRGGARIDLSAE